MKIKALLAWQWQGYHRYHQSKINIAIHLFAVPLFIAACISLIVSLVFFNLPLLFGSICTLLVAMVLQAVGHRQEPLAPEKFTGASNFILRLLFEQFITFPKFIWTSNITRSREH